MELLLDQLLMELHRFLLILDKETLSGNATIQKGLLSDLLQSYKASTGADEEYIYMNKVIVTGKDKDSKGNRSDALVNGKAAKYIPVPQKTLPDLPPPRVSVVGREPFPLPAVPTPACIETTESYYEEAQPYEETFNGKNSGSVFFISSSPYLFPMDTAENVHGKAQLKDCSIQYVILSLLKYYCKGYLQSIMRSLPVNLGIPS